MSDPNLQAATGIGQRLVREAVWHQGRCNWVGATPQEEAGGSIAIAYSALGPDLYGGTSGVALFLAELYLATDDPDLRRTALGALRQALAGATQLPESVRPSLYAGGVGVALAAALASRLLGVEELAAAAARLAIVDPAPTAERDLLSGDAGTIIGLLTLARLLDGGERLRTRAVAFGASLLASASQEQHTLSWPSLSLPGEPRLTGLSHGASGCALALLELWQATGELGYLAAANAAFAYERTLYDRDAANWPDLRGEHGAAAGMAGSSGRKFASLWCHGAPGIALARLRSVQLNADEQAPAEARVALGTTRRAVEAELAHGGNFSVCHGLAGNAEILLHGFAALGFERDADVRLALRVAGEGIERYAASPGGWPCGTFEGETAGLFLGLAGIGRFYLRLAEPWLPSLVMPVPQELGGVAATRSPAAEGM
jgi:lantibiotic modifying enzyme